MKYTPTLLTALATLALSACTHYYYAPNSVQTPYLQEKGDTRAGFSFVSGDDHFSTQPGSLFDPSFVIGLSAP